MAGGEESPGTVEVKSLISAKPTASNASQNIQNTTTDSMAQGVPLEMDQKPRSQENLPEDGARNPSAELL